MRRIAFFSDPAVAREAIETLYRVQQLHPFFLYGFVVMPDHVHILLRVPAPETIARVMNVYKSGLTFNTGIRKMWQRGYHVRIVHDATAALRYVHMNPVRKSLADIPEHYPWSSASGKWDVTEFGIL